MNDSMSEEEPPKADSRQNLRAPSIIQKIHLDAERLFFFGYSKNISRSGLFVASTHPLNPGEQIDLEIPLPINNETIRCKCEVVWRRPLGKQVPFEPGMGLKFIDMPPEVSKQIDDWIKSQI